MRRAVRVAGVVAGVWLVVVIAAWVAQERLIFAPSTATPLLPEGAEAVRLVTADGVELGAAFMPARGEVGRRPAVLIANGNGGHRGLRESTGRLLRDRGHHVLLMDYRGYGDSEGTPSLATLPVDVRAGLAHLRLRDEVSAVVVLGESIGSAAVAGVLGDSDPPDGAVLRSPPSSVGDVGARAFPFLPVRTLLRDDIDVVAAVAAYEGPVTVVLGTADGIIAPGLSRRVADARAGVTLIEIDGAGHNDVVMFDGDELLDAVDAVVDAVR